MQRRELVMGEDPYRKFASRYDAIFEPMNRNLRSLGLKMYPPKAGMKVLDVGCGTGVHLDKYLSADCEIHGIDSSPSMLEVAKKRLGDRAELYLGDATDMPYENRLFDLVISMLALHEMGPGTRSSVIGEMKRVLKGDGRILLIDYHPGSIRSLKGWLMKVIIFLSEVGAGREHYINFRGFMSVKGLPTIIAEHHLREDQRKIVGGGNIAMLLLRADNKVQ
jgi:ubiquinone/menaquinone biosynthesis C-methylase UbiE